MKEIGGYFELELCRHQELHAAAQKFNSGRNCLEFILRHRRFHRVHVPFYCCEVLLKTIHKTGTEYLLYNINEYFEPILTTHVVNDEALLYINYFGICDAVVDNLAKEYPNLIIDNSQAFFSPPLHGIDTFYSPRKFFGVPDGGYLYSTIASSDDLEQDQSVGRLRHLLLRIESNASAGYNAYRRNEQRIDNLPLKRMSKLTHRILCSIDYDGAKKYRESNFALMHSTLAKRNILPIEISQVNGPLVYPYLTGNGAKLRAFLRNNNVYCATYWPEHLECVFEGSLQRNLVALPVDQRMTDNDLSTVLELISSYDRSLR
jgi:hypothetical protein